jgi:hypothetical protein
MKIVLAHFLRCEVSGTHLRHYKSWFHNLCLAEIVLLG